MKKTTQLLLAVLLGASFQVQAAWDDELTEKDKATEVTSKSLKLLKDELFLCYADKFDVQIDVQNFNRYFTETEAFFDKYKDEETFTNNSLRVKVVFDALLSVRAYGQLQLTEPGAYQEYKKNMLKSVKKSDFKYSINTSWYE